MTELKVNEEIEFSKKWVEANPELFTGMVLELLDQHQGDFWNVSVTQTAGFFSVHATEVRHAQA